MPPSTKVPKKNAKSTEPPTLRRQTSDTDGDAHRIFDKYATSNGLHITQREMIKICEQMQQEQRLLFTSKKQLNESAAKYFKEADTNHDKKVSFSEFLLFYKNYLMGKPDEVLATLSKTATEVDMLFLKFDRDRNMNLASTELRAMMRARTPAGIPPPTDEQLDAIALALLDKFDTDKSQHLSHDQFCAAFNEMIDALSELFASLKQRRLAEVTRADEELDEDDMEALHAQTKLRYDGKVWFTREGELTGGAVEGGNVLERCRAAGKLALILKHPEDDFDCPTQHFSRRLGVLSVLDVQRLMVEMNEPDNVRDGKEKFVETLRASLEEGWRDGKVVVWRLGHTAPDFMLGLHTKGVLPHWLYSDESLRPGPLATKEHAAELLPMVCGEPLKEIADGFQLVLTSCFHMHNYRKLLSGKLPLHAFQPVQICRSLTDLAETCRAGKVSVDEEDLDDVLDKLDKLADQL